MGGGVVTPDRRRTLGRRRSSQISYRYFLRETFLFVVLFFFCWFVLFLRMTKRSTPRRPFGFSEAVDSRGLWALSLSLSLSLSLPPRKREEDGFTTQLAPSCADSYWNRPSGRPIRLADAEEKELERRLRSFSPASAAYREEASEAAPSQNVSSCHFESVLDRMNSFHGVDLLVLSRLAQLFFLYAFAFSSDSMPGG